MRGQEMEEKEAVMDAELDETKAHMAAHLEVPGRELFIDNLLVRIYHRDDWVDRPRAPRGTGVPRSQETTAS